jgi:hypothetical protein
VVFATVREALGEHVFRGVDGAEARLWVSVFRLVDAKELYKCGSDEGLLDAEVEFLEGSGAAHFGVAEERAYPDSPDALLRAG